MRPVHTTASPLLPLHRSPRQQRQDRMSERIRHETHQERTTRLLASGAIPSGIWDDVPALRSELARTLAAHQSSGGEDCKRQRLGAIVEVLERRIGELREQPGIAVAAVPEVEIVRRPARRGGA